MNRADNTLYAHPDGCTRDFDDNTLIATDDDGKAVLLPIGSTGLILKQHPLSAAFPTMPADEYQVLADSIGKIGVQNPITLFEGMVIDGWHRYRAATEAGMDCPSKELGDVDPQDFVMAQNKARRHISQAQLAMATTDVYKWKSVGNPAFAQSGTECPIAKTNSELAEISGVGERTIKQAKSLQTYAAPEVVEAVKRGEVGLPKATAIAKLPLDEQAAALHKPAPKPAKPAKPTPVVEPETEVPADYTELDALREHVGDLQADLVVARMGDIPEEEKLQAETLIADLRAEVKSLTATLKAAYLARDSLMEENAQMKRQMQMQRKEIDKLKNSK
ncbi:hypothetical protein [Polaromonas sp. CG9_12]|nr:hypothetical protein [Polaromonas sp. CG9_12]